jgi:serine/threonine-protein kinase RsbT
VAIGGVEDQNPGMSAARARDPRVRLTIREEADVGVARRCARDLAVKERFPEVAVGAVAIAVSEIARNIVVHAGSGEIVIGPTFEGGRRGLLVVARDEHPGIPDVSLAMQDGYSTAGGLGLGLSGARRLMDEFTIDSAVGRGTTITMKKWAAPAHG